MTRFEASYEGTGDRSHWIAYGEYTLSTFNLAVHVELEGGFHYNEWEPYIIDDGADHELGYDSTITKSSTGTWITQDYGTGDFVLSDSHRYPSGFNFERLRSGDYTVELFSYINNHSLGAGTSKATTTITVPQMPQYTLTYNANAPSGTTPSGTTEEEVQWADSNFTFKECGYSIEGYIFVGWCIRADGSSHIWTAGQAMKANASSTFYAIWARPNSFTVYDVDGNKHKGLVSVYDVDGNKHDVAISFYDDNGNRHDVQ